MATGSLAWRRETRSYHSRGQYSSSRGAKTHVNQGIPSLIEITLGNNADGLADLNLNHGRNRDHEPYYLLFDRVDLILGKLVLPILVCPVPFDEVFEVQSARETGI